MLSKCIDTPVGSLVLVAEGGFLVSARFGCTGNERTVAPAVSLPDYLVLERAEEQLQLWFAGSCADFDLPLAPKGTPFQCAVWTALRRIPRGKTVSYSAIADAVGNPLAVRAVGMANNRNPLPIFIPCHRVVGKGGNLTGYAAGLEVKAWLLRHEGVFVHPDYMCDVTNPSFY